LGYYNAITGWNNVFLIQLGSPIGDMYGYQVDGIYKGSDDVTKAPKYGNGSTVAVAPGDMKIRDVNGDGIIDDKDRVVVGNSLPQFTAGFTNKIIYKDFDLSFVLQIQQGGNIINGLWRNPWGTPGSNIPKEFYNNMYLDVNANADVKYPNVTSKAPILFTNSLTSLAVYDASYIRLRSFSIGYNIPLKIISKMKIQNARIAITGQNLFTITKYPGYNPEVSLNGNSVTQPGIDQGVYPQVRTIIMGINVGF